MHDRQKAQAARAQGDGGQAMVFVMMAGLALMTVMVVLLATLGGVVNDRARARTAADAVALAGARSGRPAADAVAAGNGAAIEQYDTEGNRTTVRVRVGRARATASAERSWLPSAAMPGGFPVRSR